MKTKGIIYAILASMLLGTGFISTKYFLGKGINTETLSVAWFFFGALISFIISFIMTKGKILYFFRKYWKIEVMLGLANGLNAIFWFKGIEIMDPSVASFILRFVAIFTIILSFIFLKERFTKMESFGVGIAMLGAFVITYSGGDLVFKGVVFMLLAALFFAIHNVLAKTIADDVDAMSLNAMRAFFSVIVIFSYSLSTGKIQTDKWALMPYVALTAALTMVIGFWLFIKAIQEMEVSKVMVVRSIDPFFVIIYSFIFLHTLPSIAEIFGGIVIIIGILTVVKAHEINQRLSKAVQELQGMFE